LATDGESYREHDPALVGTILGEAAHLLRHLGFAVEHIVLIGGVVPSLLILDPGGGHPHLGTGDLDLCLSVAIVEGDTGEYERIETALKKAGYGPTDESFRWKQTRRLGLQVEFFCPAGEGRPAAKMFRPRADESPTAKLNFGPKLSAFAIDAGEVIGLDVVIVEREVTLPEDGGRTNFSFRVTGLVAFLVAKTAALVGRDKPKDAYDIVWIIENWDGGPVGAASAVMANAVLGREDVRAALSLLSEKFSRPDELGPSAYSRFMAEPGAGIDERARLSRGAAGAVQEFFQALPDLFG